MKHGTVQALGRSGWAMLTCSLIATGALAQVPQFILKPSPQHVRIMSYNVNWDEIFPAYENARKPNGDAIAELSKRNFVEMSDLSGDPMFQLRKKIEAKFHAAHPDIWTPLYSMVTFSPEVPYAEALRVGDVQKHIMDQVMQLPEIDSDWDEPYVMDQLYKLATAYL